MKFDTIHHVALICSDYKASRHFYVDLLGFEIIRENYRENRGDYKLDLKLGDCELELFAIPGSPARPSYPEACGLRHLAFRVGCIEDTIRELQELGIETEPVRIDEFTQKKMTFFKGVAGLCQRPAMEFTFIDLLVSVIDLFPSLKPLHVSLL